MGGHNSGQESTDPYTKVVNSSAQTDTYVVFDATTKYGRVYLDLIHPFNLKVMESVCLITTSEVPTLRVSGKEAVLKKLGDGTMGSMQLTQAVIITRPGITHPYAIGLVEQTDGGSRGGRAPRRGASTTGTGSVLACKNHFTFGATGVISKQLAAHNGGVASGLDAKAMGAVIARGDGRVKLHARNLDQPNFVKVLLEVESAQGTIELVRRQNGVMSSSAGYRPTIHQQNCDPKENAAYGARLIGYLAKLIMNLDEYITEVAATCVATQHTEALVEITAKATAGTGPPPTPTQLKLATLEGKLSGLLNVDGSVPKPGPLVTKYGADPVWANLGTDQIMSRLQANDPALWADIYAYINDSDSESVMKAGGGAAFSTGSDLRVPFVRISSENDVGFSGSPGSQGSSIITASAGESPVEYNMDDAEDTSIA